MLIYLMIATSLVLIAFITAIVVDVWKFKKARKLQDEHNEKTEALIAAINKLKIDVVEFESMKRHIRVLITQLDELENRLDQELEPFIVDGDNLDLDALEDHVNNTKVVDYDYIVEGED